MSDKPDPREEDEIPPGDSAPPENPADAPPPTGSTPPPPTAPGPATGTNPSVPVIPPDQRIEYAMPEAKTWLPSPALIKNLGCIFKMLFALTVLLCLGYFALMALNPKARQWALQGNRDGSGGPTPFKALNQVMAIPAQAMGKTDDVVKANNARVGVLNGVIAQEEGKERKNGGAAARVVTDPFATPAASGPAKAAAGSDSATAENQAISREAILAMSEKKSPTSPSPAGPAVPVPVPVAPKPAVPLAPAQSRLPGDIVITSASPEGAPAVTAPFFYWVMKLNVSGINPGKPARMLLNGRLVHEGDEVSKALGITFVQLDDSKKLIVFRDATGAVVTRSY